MGFWDRVDAALAKVFGGFDRWTTAIERASEAAREAGERVAEFFRIALDRTVRSIGHTLRNLARIAWYLFKLTLVAVAAWIPAAFGLEILRNRTGVPLMIFAWGLIAIGALVIVLMGLTIIASLSPGTQSEGASSKPARRRWGWFAVTGAIALLIVAARTAVPGDYQFRTWPLDWLQSAVEFEVSTATWVGKRFGLIRRDGESSVGDSILIVRDSDLPRPRRPTAGRDSIR